MDEAGRRSLVEEPKSEITVGETQHNVIRFSLQACSRLNTLLQAFGL
jgi:hypothetical protein